MVFPLISIILSIILILPKITKGKFEIKIFYILLAGILYYNSPLYFKALFNTQEALTDLLYYGIKENYFVKSNLLLGISLPLITAGYLVVTKEVKNTHIQLHDNVFRLKREHISVYSLFALLFLILATSETGLTIGSTYTGGGSNFYMPLIRMINLAGVIFIFNRIVSNRFSIKLKDLSREEVVTLVIISLFIIYVLIGGDRGPAFTILLIGLFGYLLMHRMAIKKTHLVFGIAIIAVLYSFFTFIEVLRLSGDVAISKEIVVSALESYEDYDPTSGLTVRTTSAAIEGIEMNLYPHTYGAFFLQAIIKGIPYFGEKFINLLFDDSLIFNAGSATLLTIQISGSGATSGLGTSFLADTFIEFGIVGIILISFLYGMMIGKFENKIKVLSFRGFSDFLLVILFIAGSFYVGRSTLGGFIVSFIHSWIYYIFIKTLFIKPFIGNRNSN